MQNDSKKIKIHCALCIVIFICAPLAAHGANPNLIATWKARSYTPLSYIGKPLPVGGTPIDVALTMVDNNRVISLSGAEIRWYQENTLVARGTGRTLFSFIAPHTGQDTMNLRVSVLNYNGRTVDQFINIPIVRPEAVIDQAALPTLKPLFYFFSITDPTSLAISWDDRGTLITLQASHKNNPLEFARAQITKP